ncbi:hypothetical protein FJTKL_03202 [Diaporthe vaccinii]|uniref:Peroxisomal-coenzyme A synthetase n=1 Tax=Diaporthe vaccinii TaxID=105482 RepID=A0ABR4DWA3_9PEZI
MEYVLLHPRKQNISKSTTMCTNSHILVLPAEREADDSPAVIVPSSNQGGSKQPSSSATSYAQLHRLSCSLQRSLARLGVTTGSKVALILPNSLEFVAAFLAVVRQRAVAALVDPQLKHGEYKQMFGLIGPALVVVAVARTDSPVARAAAELGLPVASCWVEDDEVHLVEERLSTGDGTVTAAPAPSQTSARAFSPHELNAEDPVLLLLTSGTTGPPKAVTLSHTNLLVAMRIIVSAHALSRADRCLIITPLSHIIGVGGSLLTTLFTGGCVVIPPSLSGALWRTCDEFKITWFHAVPTLWRLIVAFPLLPGSVFPPTLRFLRSGGSDMAPDLYARLQGLGPPVLEVYGMTETAPAIFCNRLDPGSGKERKLGHYPIADAVDVMILAPSSVSPVSSEEDEEHCQQGIGGQEDNNRAAASTATSSPPPPAQHDGDPVIRRLTKAPGISGEICVRGKSVTATGYVGNPEANGAAFLRNGFFRTGDLGVLRPDGYLQLAGRIKETINKGGEKVSPAEIEHLALSHEAVAHAACFRVADDMYGEDIGLAVVLHSSATHCKEARLKKHFRQHAALFKVPKVVSFVIYAILCFSLTT